MFAVDVESVRWYNPCIFVLFEHLDGFHFFRPCLQDIILDLLVNFLLSFAGTGLESISELILLFDLFWPKRRVNLQLVFILHWENFGVCRIVEWILWCNPFAGSAQIFQFSKFAVFLVFERGDFQEFFHCFLHEVVQPCCHELCNLLHFSHLRFAHGH